MISTGGLCVDPSGTACGNFACQQGSIAPQAVAATDDRVPLKTAEWIQDDKLRLEVGKVSPMFNAVILALQHIAEDNTALMKEGVELHLHLYSRAKFPIDVFFSKVKDTWTIRTDRADPNEGLDAPSMLEITGREWTLLAHDHASPTKLKAIANGSF